MLNNLLIFLLLSTVNNKIMLSLIITIVGFSMKLLSPFYDDTEVEYTEPQHVS